MVDSRYHLFPPLQDPLPPPPSHLSSSVSNGLTSQRSIRSIAFSLPSLAEESEQELEEQRKNQPEYKENEEETKLKDEQDEEEEEERYRPHCSICGAWMFFGLFAVVFVVLIISLVFAVVLRSALPEIAVLRMNFSMLNVTNENNDILLDADVHIRLQVFNINECVQLEYSELNIQISSEDIPLGESKIPGFSQKPMNKTVLRMRTHVSNSPVNEYDAKALEENVKNHQVVVNVVLNGNIGFHVGVVKLNWVPAIITCQNIKQADVDFAKKPKCNVKIFGFRAS